MASSALSVGMDGIMNIILKILKSENPFLDFGAIMMGYAIHEYIGTVVKKSCKRPNVKIMLKFTKFNGYKNDVSYF